MLCFRNARTSAQLRSANFVSNHIARSVGDRFTSRTEKNQIGATNPNADTCHVRAMIITPHERVQPTLRLASAKRSSAYPCPGIPRRSADSVRAAAGRMENHPRNVRILHETSFPACHARGCDPLREPCFQPHQEDREGCCLDAPFHTVHG